MLWGPATLSASGKDFSHPKYSILPCLDPNFGKSILNTFLWTKLKLC